MGWRSNPYCRHRQRTGQASPALTDPKHQRWLAPSAQPYSSAAFTGSEAAVLERPQGLRDLPQPSRAGTERVGVLLLNLGGPETLADVKAFLYNLFADDSIIRLPAQGARRRPQAQQFSSLCTQPLSSSCACSTLSAEAAGLADLDPQSWQEL